MGWLDQTVALVTGAGSGLGRAIVDRFRAEGADVGVVEIDPAKAGALRTERGALALSLSAR
jgi:NAD(P)-dependent dehydrogenase (short-subunit alcohol dehydrogenase family)